MYFHNVSVKELALNIIIAAFLCFVLAGEVLGNAHTSTKTGQEPENSKRHDTLVNRDKFVADVDQTNPQDQEALLNSRIETELDRGNLPGAIKHLDMAAELIKNRKDDGDYIQNRIKVGELHFQLRNYDQARETYQLALERSREISDEYGTMQAITGIGHSYFYQGSYDKTLEYYLQSLNHAEEQQNQAFEATAYINIANVLGAKDDYRKAIDYLKKALEIFQALDDSRNMAVCYNNIAGNYIKLTEVPEARENAQKALDIHIKLGDQKGEAAGYQNMGIISFMESEYEKAIDYYQSALAIGEDMGDKYRVAESLADLAISYRQAGAYDDVIRVAKRGLELSKDIKVNVAQRLFYENLAATYDSLGQYKKAYEYQKLYKQIDDSIYAINNRQQVLDMEARYQNERKENEILALTNDISLQAIQLEKNRNFRIFVSVAGLLLLVLFVVFYRLYDLRLKTARILAEKNVELEIANQNLSISENALKSLNSTKDKFFTIIAHDIRNPLSAYRSITKSMVGSYNRLSEAQKLEHIESIYQSSENLYRLLDNLLHWAVSQSGALRVNPKEIDLDVVCFKTARLLQASADMKEITLACEVPEDSFAYADLNMVSTVVTNLLSNAIKFTAPQGHVNISAKEKGEQLIVSISDDGIGISAEDQLKLFKVDVDQKTIGNSIEKGSGVGLLLCKEFVEKNGGKIWVESIPGKGSTFHFSLPKMPEETSQSV